MKVERKRYIVDTSALFAYIYEEPEAAYMEDILLDADDRKVTLYITAVQYGELLYVIERDFGKERRALLQQHVKNLPLHTIDSTQSQAEVAATYKVRGGISYPDCFAIALAQEKQAKILTKDKEFAKFANDLEIEWLEASYEQEAS